MASTDDPSHQLQNQYELLERQAGDQVPPDDATRLKELGEALDENKPYPVYEGPDGKESYTATTVRNYLLRLRVDVCKNGHSLTEISPEEFNELMGDLDEDRARSTTTQTQSAAKHFYRYHDDLGVDPEEIVIFEEDRSAKEVDPDDLITHDELEALRQEVDGTQNPIRNRALLEMLVYTGQRLRALQTLRIKDVHPEEKPGHILLNDGADGLKDATERGRYRPLLAARKYVREWKERHPQRDDPEAWFFIGQPGHSGSDTSSPWSSSAMRRMLYRAADKAGIYDRETDTGKKPKPHAFRHFWYTSMRRDPDFDPEDLKAAGGWSESSNTPELIYKNFKDEEHMERLEVAAGEREPDDEIDRFIPETCPVCGEPLKSHWKECPACEERLVEDPTREAEEDVMSDRFQAEDEEIAEVAKEIQQAIMENPELLREYLDE